MHPAHMYTRLASALLIAFVVFLPTTASAYTPVLGTITPPTSTGTKPTLEGTATRAGTTVRVVVRSEADKIVFKKDVRVKEGEWYVRVSKRLKKGDYEVSLYAGKTSRDSALLDTENLTIGKKKTATVGAGTALSVSSVPLLFGGTARAYSSVPVAYVKVVNMSKKESAITGITLIQNGSAPTTVITGFATSDDKGGSRTTVDAKFKGKSVLVPLVATLAPGQMRIFTLKAMVGPEALSNIGTQLMLDVASVETGATLGGRLPLRGTTWTLGY